MHWYNSDNPAPVTCGVGTRDCDWFKSLLTEHEWLHRDVSGFFILLSRLTRSWPFRGIRKLPQNKR